MKNGSCTRNERLVARNELITMRKLLYLESKATEEEEHRLRHQCIGMKEKSRMAFIQGK